MGKMKEIVTRGRLARVQGGMYGSDTMLEMSNGDNEEAQMKNSLIE